MTEKVAKKESSRPWAKKIWTKDRFSLEKKRKGYRIRFISQENISEKKHEGWSVANGENYGEDAGDIIRKGMIAMETSEQNALDREAFFSDLTDCR